jgi:nucleoside-diphosphate-sugar epimerase
MKTYLVTGGTGFIGSNLIRKLLSPRHLIHVFVSPNDDLWRIKDIVHNIIVHYIDLTNLTAVSAAVMSIKPEVIFHLASFGGMPDETSQETIFKVNFYASMNLFNACKKANFDCFINAGSSSEYGKKDVPMSEDLVLEPISDYAVAKAAFTQFLFKEAMSTKLPVYTIRPFSVYGDRELQSRLIPTILLNLIVHKQLQLSSPHFVRDYIYIDDMVNALLALENKKPREAFVFNAGTGVQSTIQDVIEAIQSWWPEEIAVIWGKHVPRPWEPTHWAADISRSKEILQWKPQYSLTDGLSRAMKWFQQNSHLYTERQMHHAKPKPDSIVQSAAY